MKSYKLLSPISLLQYHIKTNQTLSEAFMTSAREHQEYYNILTSLATLVKAHPEITIQADTCDEIWINAPPELMKEWVDMGYVVEEVDWNDPKNIANWGGGKWVRKRI